MDTFKDPLKNIDTFISEIDSAVSIEGVFLALEKHFTRIGFTRFSYQLLMPPKGQRFPLYISNYPQNWVEYYVKEGFVSHDPITRNAVNIIRPYVWSEVIQGKTLTKTQKIVLSGGHEASLRSGASVPIQGPGRAIAQLSVANDMCDNEFKKLFLQHRHEVHLLATYAHERLISLKISGDVPYGITLTPKEVEVLTWAARGKSSWDIACILAISNATVNEHLANVRRKLDTTNTTHAIATAILNGLILP